MFKHCHRCFDAATMYHSVVLAAQFLISGLCLILWCTMAGELWALGVDLCKYAQRSEYQEE
jgi:hypothetical protein